MFSTNFRLLCVIAGTFAVSIAAQESVTANPDAGFPKSPEIHEDGRVTFRLLAPNAETVELRGSFPIEKKALALTDKDKGLWEITVGPLPPEIYNYSFRVDGTMVLDPHNRWFKGWRRSANLFEITSDSLMAWQRQNVPRGTLHKHVFRSSNFDFDREVFVYTPPGYEDNRTTYPVLFLLHGSGDDASAWTSVGRADVIADNLIAASKMKPMVIVMPHGHAPFDGKETIQDKEDWWTKHNRVVDDSFFDDYVQFAKKRYRINVSPEKSAVAGLSMGGGQSLRFGLLRPELFGWVLAYSAGSPDKASKLNETFGKMPAGDNRQLLWIACGKKDKLLGRNKLLCEWLDERNVPYIWKETEGGHSWPIWRGYLIETLPLLFQ